MQHYIFISYLQNNQIVRQFMTKKNATYKERFLSFLPIGNLHFKSNKCLTQLATNNKPNFICDENKSVRQTLKENIYYIEHQFETGKDKMLSINQAGLLEIYCSNSKVLNTIESFSIFVISDNCNLYFNSMLLFRATTNQTGIKPSLIFVDTKFLTIPTQQNVHKIINTTPIGILIIKVGYKAGYKILVRIKIKGQQNIHNSTEELNELQLHIE